ncbi:MAG: ATP-binding protein [Treponema sp.]|nr:ATP-binding protein [Treponema sp.]
MKRLLPVGIQDFAKIRDGGFCYVDKTAGIHRLISGGAESFFLSRPRRFGKSLLCSTLGAIFEGRRELFRGLAIDTLEWEWKKHPVIRLDLNAGVYSNGVEALHSVLHSELRKEAERHDITLESADPISQFKYLIRKAHRAAGERVAVIIDEYDKPLLNTIDKPQVHMELRDELKGFYGTLKSSDEHLRFVLLTGVTKFSHVSVFSDLNHLTDLNLDPRYADLCGITQEELERNFEPEVDAILRGTGRNRENYLAELRRFYNGYRFSERPVTVYNPFGLLHHFAGDGKFLSYRYDTGTPTFLTKLIIEQKIDIVELGNLRVGYEDFRNYDIETMRAEPVLYQSGYLTIADYDEELGLFTLDYPNDEVRSYFARSLLEHYAPAPEVRAVSTHLLGALYDGNVDPAMETLKRFFAAIPYDIIRQSENYYQTAIHLIFTLFGFNCRSEVRIAAGRIDTLLETKKHVYCFEFKLDGTADEALAQIDTKEYLLPWAASGKTLFKVGVSFDTGKRNIGEWKVAKVPAA